MAELRYPRGADPDAPLRGLTVVEVLGEFGRYAGRLLVDLGGDVTQVRLPGASSEAVAGADRTQSGIEASEWFLDRGKRRIEIGEGTGAVRETVHELIESADVLLQSHDGQEGFPVGLDPESVRRANPDLIHVILTPFGLDGPSAHWASTDLIRLAAGGLLWLGGYPDAGPVAPYGGQSTIATDIFGVIAALIDLLARDGSGAGRTVEICSQEAMVQALETSIPEFELTGNVRTRLGSTPREAGSGIYRCRDGYVSMIAGRLGTAKAWRQLRQWLIEEGVEGAAELNGPEWDELPYRQRPESIERFGEILGSFIADRGKHELYLAAQERSIALSPVNTPAEVLADPQLRAREFFLGTSDPETGIHAELPSPPYRMSPPRGPEHARRAVAAREREAIE